MEKGYQIRGKLEGKEIYVSKIYPTWLEAKRLLNRLKKEHPSRKYQMYVYK